MQRLLLPTTTNHSPLPPSPPGVPPLALAFHHLDGNISIRGRLHVLLDLSCKRGLAGGGSLQRNEGGRWKNVKHFESSFLIFAKLPDLSAIYTHSHPCMPIFNLVVGSWISQNCEICRSWVIMGPRYTFAAYRRRHFSDLYLASFRSGKSKDSCSPARYRLIVSPGQ